MENEWKSLRVKEDTHTLVKTLAAAEGKTIDDCLKDVINDWRYLTARDLARGKSLASEQPAATHAAAEAANLLHRQAMRDHEKEG